MIIPNLMTKIQWIQLHSQFKHAYSVLSNAVRLVYSDEEFSVTCYYPYNYRGGDIPRTDCQAFYKQLQKTLKIAQICEGNAYAMWCVPKYHGTNDIPELSDEDSESQSRNCESSRTTSLLNSNLTYVLKDGIILTMTGRGAYINVDINGKKGPNKWGYDLFPFTIEENITGNLYLAPSSKCENFEKDGKSVKQMLIV